MAIEKVDIQNFLALSQSNLIIDARSPGEFIHAHIPGAHSLPLFTDDERKVVGTAYKQQGRRQAIKLGLDFFGPKMRRMVEEVESLLASKQLEGVLVHCWRGGMRSEAIAWLLNLYGFKVYLLKGGYKTFRNYVLDTFSLPFEIRILSGYTGSGKTDMLQVLALNTQPVIDLEKIACHKGSAFGAINQPPQPSQEMFENLLALQLRAVNHNPFWLEDESRRIGTLVIPPQLWEQMEHATLYFLDIPFERRLEKILSEYGMLDKEKIIDAIRRIQKRLGGLETKTAVRFLEENNLPESFRILLKYYDKCYQKSMASRLKINPAKIVVPCLAVNALDNGNLLLNSLPQTTTIK